MASFAGLNPLFEEILNETYDFVIDLLQNRLPSYLTYHNTQHTREVVEAVAELSKAEGLTEEETFLVTIAAIFHDTGYIESAEEHEELSCRIARQHLQKYEAIPEEKIDEVCEIIMATKMPVSPAKQLEKIMCDADLFYLGTTDFKERSDRLYEELKYFNKVKDRDHWQQIEIDFFTSHQFYSTVGRQQLDKVKQHNFHTIMNENKKSITGNKSSDYRNLVNDCILISLGVIVAGFALKGFLVPNRFFDGGVSGVSLLLHELYHWNLPLVIIIVNLPFIIVSFFTVSKGFAIKTFCSVLLLDLCILWVPYPIITSDKLLISMFGGFFLGLGMGLTMRAGSALDGVEVLALYTIKRTSFTITEIILAINIVIFGFAAAKFGIETALYSVLTYFTASLSINYVVEGIEAYTGVTIISGESEAIKSRLVNELGRGITVYKGERGFLPGNFEVSEDCDIIFTVVTRLELRKLKNLVHESDPRAFVFAATIKEASGGVVKKLHKH